MGVVAISRSSALSSATRHIEVVDFYIRDTDYEKYRCVGIGKLRYMLEMPIYQQKKAEVFTAS